MESYGLNMMLLLFEISYDLGFICATLFICWENSWHALTTLFSIFSLGCWEIRYSWLSIFQWIWDSVCCWSVLYWC